ncbi:hypothetical protein ACHHYP_10513 [Achlya hypogyna]|uniref:Uncharacterized protein n=1 Tax=Achlya hypogyna TaxID=1202772 RepID=A0A1V9YL74_ACHHY|nr:hypothetical protein ACHHYP_10513 [Achlya hypogyna]
MRLLCRVSLPKALQSLLGLAYLALSLACSVWFLDIVSPGLSNDLFWPGFEPTTAHTYLIDSFSAHLAVTGSAVIDLFDPSEAIIKAYGLSTTNVQSKPTYPRALALGQFTTIEDAVVSFRTVEENFIFTAVTQYCWADFDKRKANTLRPQFAMNGAVYLEPYLRNIIWSDWYTAYGSSFASAVSDAIVVTKDGAEWYTGLQDAFTSVDSEVTYWTSKNITLFQLQWSNDMQMGIQESITVINMFGWRQALTVTYIPFNVRSSMWTCNVLNGFFITDLWGAAITNASLVRSASNFMGDATMEMLLMLYPYTPCSVIVHDHLRPFQSIDMYLIPPPPALVSAVTTLQSGVVIAIHSHDGLLSRYRALSATVLDPVPLHWQSSNCTFFGGSPMCVFGTGATFVQPSFSFDDMWCTTLFATVALALVGASVDDACRPCKADTSGSCRALTQATSAMVSQLLSNATVRQLLTPTLATATRDVQRMKVEIIQFALTPTGNSTVLRQPLLDATASSWDLFGYVTLHEWVLGYREVVSIQGDVASYTLMSERIAPIPFSASASEVPMSTCRYLWTTVVLITCILLAIGIATAVALPILSTLA